jgi:MFS family permease
MMIISGAVTPFSARIVERTGPRIPILTGLGLMAIGGIGLALLDPTTPTWILPALLVPIGLTGPLVMPPPLPCCSTVSGPGEPAPPAAYSTPAAKSPVPLLSPSSGAFSPPPPDSSTASKSAS